MARVVHCPGFPLHAVAAGWVPEFAAGRRAAKTVVIPGGPSPGANPDCLLLREMYDAIRRVVGPLDQVSLMTNLEKCY